ncbi:MAG: acetyl-CoA carboxylase biotin carboxyl carrier protein subunit, partial [Gemmatimonadota bacterium]
VRYYVTLDGETREVELTPEGVRVDGVEVEAEIATLPGTSLRHLRIGDRGWLLSAERADGGWAVRLGGRRVDVHVEDERTRSIRELAGAGGPGEGPRELRAPMPGLVVRVLAEPGHEVEAGDGLVVMEAMKMENELSARGAGTVSEVRVEEGQTVNRDDVLVTLEDLPDREEVPEP